MVRQALRIRLPVTFAVVLLALLLALAVVGCSFGEGEPEPPRSRILRRAPLSFQTDVASTSSAVDRALLPSSLKWAQLSYEATCPTCRILLLADIWRAATTEPTTGRVVRHPRHELPVTSSTTFTSCSKRPRYPARTCSLV